jgi:hypothetical protein
MFPLIDYFLNFNIILNTITVYIILYLYAITTKMSNRTYLLVIYWGLNDRVSLIYLFFRIIFVLPILSEHLRETRL